MSANSKIEWTDHTFNPWIGCTKVGPACDHCYAERSTPSRTLGVVWGAGQPRRRTTPANWNLPLRWNAQADAFMAQHGRRQRVFCASLADVFDNEVHDLWRADLFDLIDATPNLDWLLLTKRIGNVRDMLRRILRPGTLPPNVWLGATIGNQTEAARDIPKLLGVPARVRFLSMEPLLGPVDLQQACTKHCPNGDCFRHSSGHRVVIDSQDGGALVECICSRLNGLHWVIVGGESGPNARPMHPDWARSLRDQCQAAGVAFHFKQWGEHDVSYDRDRDDPDYRRCDAMARLPGRWINLAGGHGFNGERVHYAHRIGKKATGRMLDGRTWDEVPA